jgi:hypothetical protein
LPYLEENTFFVQDLTNIYLKPLYSKLHQIKVVLLLDLSYYDHFTKLSVVTLCLGGYMVFFIFLFFSIIFWRTKIIISGRLFIPSINSHCYFCQNSKYVSLSSTRTWAIWPGDLLYHSQCIRFHIGCRQVTISICIA